MKHQMKAQTVVLVLSLVLLQDCFLLVNAKSNKKASTTARDIPVFFPEASTTNRGAGANKSSSSKKSKRKSSTAAGTATARTQTVFFPLTEPTTQRQQPKSTKSSKKKSSSTATAAGARTTDSVFFSPEGSTTGVASKNSKASKASKKDGNMLTLAQASTTCPFQPSGGAALLPSNVVQGTGPASSTGIGNLNVGFDDGFTEMGYSIVISADVAAIRDVGLFCGLPGSPSDDPIVPLNFREPGSSSASTINGPILQNGVSCFGNETSINNVVSLYDAMRRGFVFVQATVVDGITDPAFLRGQVVVATSPGRCGT